MKKGDTFRPPNPYVLYAVERSGITRERSRGSNLKLAHANFTVESHHLADYPQFYTGVYLVDIRTMKILRAIEFKEPK